MINCLGELLNPSYHLFCYLHSAILFEVKSTVISIVSHLPSPPHKFLPFSFPKFAGQSPMSDNSEVARQNLDRKPVEHKPLSLCDIIEDVSYLDLKVGTYLLYFYQVIIIL